MGDFVVISPKKTTTTCLRLIWMSFLNPVTHFINAVQGVSASVEVYTMLILKWSERIPGLGTTPLVYFQTLKKINKSACDFSWFWGHSDLITCQVIWKLMKLVFNRTGLSPVRTWFDTCFNSNLKSQINWLYSLYEVPAYSNAWLVEGLEQFKDTD